MWLVSYFSPLKYLWTTPKYSNFIFLYKNSIDNKVCECCGKVCMNNKEYLRHMRLHSISKKYGCEFCEKTFHLKIHLENHLRVHTGYFLFFLLIFHFLWNYEAKFNWIFLEGKNHFNVINVKQVSSSLMHSLFTKGGTKMWLTIVANVTLCLHRRQVWRDIREGAMVPTRDPKQSRWKIIGGQLGMIWSVVVCNIVHFSVRVKWPSINIWKMNTKLR